MAGEGDRVFKYVGEAQGLRITNRGSGDFVVTTYGDSGDLLVNEIGNYSGDVDSRTSSNVHLCGKQAPHRAGVEGAASRDHPAAA